MSFFIFRGSEIYPPVTPYDMMNQIGASTPSGDDVVGTTSALVMGAGDSVVAGYNKDEGVVNLLYSSVSRFHNLPGMLVSIFFVFSRSGFCMFLVITLNIFLVIRNPIKIFE